MKLLLSTGALLIWLATFLRAQTPALPSPESSPAAPSPSATPYFAPRPELLPSDILPVPKTTTADPSLPSIPQLDQGFTAQPRSPIAETQRKHLEWRRLKNEVRNDRQVKAALETAEAARTDLEKRKLLARYYDLFYAKMTARAAPEMKGYLADRKMDALQSLPQPRVRPETARPKQSGASDAPSPPLDESSPSPSTMFSPSSVPDRAALPLAPMP